MPDTMIESLRRDPAEVAQSWAAWKEANPRGRARDAASAIGVSEAELLATLVGREAVRLLPRWKALVEALPTLGRVMALTRNEWCVHEKVGRYDQVQLNEQGGVVLDPDIDLRLFFSRWHHAFAQTEAGGRQSLQVFDRDGTAVHKVYLRDEGGDAAAFARLVAEFRHADQTPGVAVQAIAPALPDRPDAEIDRAALEARWRALKDTHDFFGMLRDLKVGREQAFRLAPDDLAREVGRFSLSRGLELAAAEALPVMVFVGSPGCIQIHTGPVADVRRFGPWQNVLDRDFNLHLREDGIARAWLVRKPTSDGIVTSLEIFDAEGRQIAWMFGKRKPGQPEDARWPLLAERAVAEGDVPATAPQAMGHA